MKEPSGGSISREATLSKLLTLLAAPVVMLALATTASAAEKKLIIGLAVAQSGWLTAYDGDPSAAIQLAADDFNKTGGILGHKIELVWSDNKSDPTLAYNAAVEVIEKGAQFVLASCDFDKGGASGVAAQERGILVMSVCSGSPKWGPVGVGELAFSTGHAAQADGCLLAEWAYKSRGWKTAYMLRDTTLTYTRAQCFGFEQRWKEIAGAKGLLGIDEFKNADPSIATQITRIKALNPQPDVIFICTYVPGGATALRQIRAAGINQPMMSGVAMGGEYWLKGVPGFSNFFVPVPGNVFGDDPSKEVNEMVKRFKAKHGKPPASALAIFGYRALQMYKTAAERAGSLDSQAVRKELEKFKNEPVMGGIASFNEKVHIQDRIRALINEVKDGKMRSTGEYYTSEKAVPYDSLFKE